MDRHVLFTNLRLVRVGDLHLPCSALLLSDVEDDDLGEPARDYSVRGFGPDPNWEVFRCGLETLENQITRAGRLANSGGLRTLDSLEFRRMAYGFELHASDADRDISAEIFEGDHRVYEEVWATFRQRVREFWPGPAFPTLSFLPAVVPREPRKKGRSR